MRKTIKIINKIICYTLSCAIILITIVVVGMKISGDMPTVFGYNFYIIVSGSMVPEINVGDIILSKKVEQSTLKVDDVVTYMGKRGEMKDKIITHKITEIISENGEKSVITKGVANQAADPMIKASEIISVMQRKVPIMSYIFKVINTKLGFLSLVILPLAILLISEIYNLIKAYKTEKEKENNEQN